MNIDNIWNKFLDLIKVRLSSLSYNTWFSSSKLVELNDNVAKVLVPTAIKNIYPNLIWI